MTYFLYRDTSLTLVWSSLIAFGVCTVLAAGAWALQTRTGGVTKPIQASAEEEMSLLENTDGSAEMSVTALQLRKLSTAP